MLSVAFLLQAKIQSLMWAKDDEIQTAVAHAEIQVLDAIDKQYQVRRKWQMSASTQKLVEDCVLFTDQNAVYDQDAMQRLQKQRERGSASANMGPPMQGLMDQQHHMEERRLQEQATVQRLREQLDRFAAFEDKGMSKQMLAEQQRLAEQLRTLQGLLEEQRHLKGQKAMAAFQEQHPSPPRSSLGTVAL
jgi:hypothetical protein